MMTAEARQTLEGTLLVRHRLEEQYANLEQQHETAAFGMWVFLATEVHVLRHAVPRRRRVYHYLYPEAFEKASEKLNWIIGGINTLVLLVSSLTAVLAVHFARLGSRRALMICLLATAALGVAFLGFKGVEYYHDLRRQADSRLELRRRRMGRTKKGSAPDQVPHVKLFLLFYWIMTGLHGLHVIDRHRGHARDVRAGAARAFLPGVLLASGRDGAVLAFCRHRLDFSAADAVPDGHSRALARPRSDDHVEHAFAPIRSASTWSCSPRWWLLTCSPSACRSSTWTRVWHVLPAWESPVVKATLVVLFFMHALESPRITWIVIASRLCWLSIMFWS